MTLVYFLLILGIIITVHEFGHMIVAKLFNVYVNEFAIGFGPALWKKQGKETKYSIRAIPLGGFTAMAEAAETPVEWDQQGNPTQILTVAESRTFYGISRWKRILVLLAGPFFNLLLAWIVFIGIFQINGFVVEPAPAVISSVVANSAAEEAGLKANDRIVRLTFADGSSREVKLFEEISVAGHEKEEIIFTVERNGQTLEIRITPRYSEAEKRYLIGVNAPAAEVREISFFQAIPVGFSFANNILKMTFDAVVGLFSGASSIDSLGGTIAIYKYTEEAAKYGLVSLLSLMGSLSISVGLMNLLPVPIFDGGKILIALIESLIRKRLPEKVEAFITYLSLALVLLLFVFVTYQDVLKLF